jgi:hypothetical protein
LSARHTGPSRRSRLAAALIMVAWLVASLGLLLLFRGVPMRLRVLFVFLSLAGIVAGIALLRARFAK